MADDEEEDYHCDGNIGVESDGDCDGEAERQKDRETKKQNDLGMLFVDCPWTGRIAEVDNSTHDVVGLGAVVFQLPARENVDVVGLCASRENEAMLIKKPNLSREASYQIARTATAQIKHNWPPGLATASNRTPLSTLHKLQ